jgi:nicotinamide phosphoribosyltransferase
VSEGTTVPTGNVLMTVENTCDQCYWLTNYLETLLVQAWYPTTVATQSRAIKQLVLSYLERNGQEAGIDYKLHDFGYRGVSSHESAAIGGAAHLCNFKGTDTVAALMMLNEYYRAGAAAGNSIPAAEHSTITSWGTDGELAAYDNMLTEYPTGLVAVVSDSYDISYAVQKLWGGKLKDKVLARDGTLVIRPDSGYPAHVVYEVVHDLGLAFGYTVNDKGYKVLHPSVRVIQGDGVDIDSIDEILRTLEGGRWSADNVAFGMGGALLQKLDRDTQNFAFKCSYAEGGPSDDRWQRNVYKSPVGQAWKKSKRGRLALVSDGEGGYVTVPELGADNLLVEVFRDGRLLVDQQFDDIRARAAL